MSYSTQMGTISLAYEYPRRGCEKAEYGAEIEKCGYIFFRAIAFFSLNYPNSNHTVKRFARKKYYRRLFLGASRGVEYYIWLYKN